jgi:hypothetical protein
VEILRDQIWQFVGAVLGLAAIVLTAILYWKQRQLKELAYEIISKTSVVSVQDEVAGKIEILYEDKPVKNVNLAVIRLVNSGNVAIKPDDYMQPVSFNFGKNAKILQTEVIKEVPDNLGAIYPSVLAGETGAVEINPILLNKGDEFTFKVLGTQLGKITVNGRIVDVKEIKTLPKKDRDLYLSGFVVLVGSLFVALFTYLLSGDALATVVVFGISLIGLSAYAYSIIDLSRMARSR